MSIRDLLRGLPVFARPLPAFDPAGAPDDPHDLFAAWFAEAVGAGVVEPHAMTLSTVDADGLPDTRVLLLKEFDGRGWQFATDATSAKGRQVAANPAAALGFYWREQGRQVRVRGSVTALDRAAADGDFLARPVGARVASLASTQSAVLDDPADLERALAAAGQTVENDPGTVCAEHTVYAVTAVSVEFWQGDKERRHIRLRYRRDGDAWVRERLWP
ncbi:pyridoxine/pyridoxamine 5'-phosphate oxidase [Actinoplanes aureus]|uniref:Pyridoxal 5'-phosphate synthase n=1 Tax=Actinoplanes aureus TaxID=2792083 RepID=A0A931C8X9_9ACTN|nr:pyridoxal 5'-phosphate synthase [Actinoplanes aureus]MBG0564334.1 pyridoxal 5'-phosphate synthase [Actinoplanes aureus]